jgi:iron complex transport system substrate-binding protein
MWRLLPVLLIFLTACIRQEGEKKFKAEEDFKWDKIELKYAKLFSITYKEDHALLKINQAGLEDYHYVLYPGSTAPKTQLKNQVSIHIPVKHVTCQATSHLGYFDALDRGYLCDGFLGTHLLRDPKHSELAKQGSIKDFGEANWRDSEALIQHNPDLLLLFPFENKTESHFRSKNNPILFIAEYAEKHPLARAEWIKLYGLLSNRLAEANELFEQIEKRYLALLEKCDEKPKVLLSKPFKDIWYMSPGNGIMGKFLEDACTQHAFANSNSSENLALSIEKVYYEGKDCDLWFLVSDERLGYSLADLGSENELYKEFDAFKNKQVFLSNIRKNDYFGKAYLEPDQVLADIMMARGKKVEGYEAKYFLRLD